LSSVFKSVGGKKKKSLRKALKEGKDRLLLHCRSELEGGRDRELLGEIADGPESLHSFDVGKGGKGGDQSEGEEQIAITNLRSKKKGEGN